MGKISWIKEAVFGNRSIVEMFPDKIGYLFNNSFFNVTSSGVGTAFSGVSTVRCTLKAIATPLPWCKVCYGAAAGFNGIATGISMGCLWFGYSALAPVPVSLSIAGLVTNAAGRGCNSLGNCLGGGLTSTAVDVCIDGATPLFIP
jgi:hypothetical protein